MFGGLVVCQEELQTPVNPDPDDIYPISSVGGWRQGQSVRV